MTTNHYIEQLLQQRFGSDPYWQMVQQMLQQPQSATTGTETDNLSDRAGDCQENLTEARRYIRRLKKRIAWLEKERAQLEATEAEMARALGACVQCWGEDPYCPDCQGQGSAGSQIPNAELFERLVLPALRRLKRSSDG